MTRSRTSRRFKVPGELSPLVSMLFVRLRCYWFRPVSPAHGASPVGRVLRQGCSRNPRWSVNTRKSNANPAFLNSTSVCRTCRVAKLLLCNRAQCTCNHFTQLQAARRSRRSTSHFLGVRVFQRCVDSGFLFVAPIFVLREQEPMSSFDVSLLWNRSVFHIGNWLHHLLVHLGHRRGK
jgi:hypothetical protein